MTLLHAEHKDMLEDVRDPSAAVTPLADQTSPLLQNIYRAIDATSKGKRVGAPFTQNDTGRPVKESLHK